MKMTYPQPESFALGRNCQGAIITMRPTSQSICTGYLPFYGSRCEQRGATILRIWLPCAIQTCGTQALVVPLFYGWDDWKHKNLMRPKVIKKILILVFILGIIYFLRLDHFLIGPNFIWTAFFILIGLGVLFSNIEDSEDEIESLRYFLHQSVFGSDSEKKEASSYAIEKKFLLDTAKRGFEKRYGKR